jgi:hypothetical protein
MHRVLAPDVLACPRSGGRLRIIATVQDPAILAHLRRSGASELREPAPPASAAVGYSSLDQALEASLSPLAPAP